MWCLILSPFGQVFPLLVEQFDNKTEDTARKNTITILAKFLEQGAKYPSLKEGMITFLGRLFESVLVFFPSYIFIIH